MCHLGVLFNIGVFSAFIVFIELDAQLANNFDLLLSSMSYDVSCICLPISVKQVRLFFHDI